MWYNSIWDSILDTHHQSTDLYKGADCGHYERQWTRQHWTYFYMVVHMFLSLPSILNILYLNHPTAEVIKDNGQNRTEFQMAVSYRHLVKSA